MRFISAKVWFWLAALLVFLFSCSRESPEPVWEAQSTYGTEYKGGLFPVYITLKTPVANASSISWATSHANIAYRKQEIDSKKQIIADTAYLYWETPPPLFERFDSTQIKKDTVVSWKIDTVRYYRDTIFAIVNSIEQSLPIIIDVKNILPRIDSIKVGGISQPVDSLLTIAANLGDKLKIELYLKKPFKNPFNKSFHSKITMPSLMGNPILKNPENDSVFVYEWTVPNIEISDSSEYLKIEDTGGYGERLYKVHLVTYTECGSVWVAAEKELVKYSPTGIEVARISGNSTGEFSSISDIAVNSNNGELFVLDIVKNSFSIYDHYGKWIHDSIPFVLPSGIAVDVEGNYVWVAEAIDPLSPVFKAKLSRFFRSGTTITPTLVSYDDMSGPIKGLSINQFQRDFVWFTIPESDTVGFTASYPERKFIMYDWNRPSMISHDQSKGIAWVADSTRIIAIDTIGNILANIDGFRFVTSVSASNNYVWATDILDNKVWLFKGPFTGSNLDIGVTPGRRGQPVPRSGFGFISPISVSAYNGDDGAWVIDKELGMAVRLDKNGDKASFVGIGLKQPLLGKTLQKVE